MYGIYSDIICAAQRALECFEETAELLEYPEVQADKAYYLSILSKYNNFKFLRDKLSELTTALEDKKEVNALLAITSDETERGALYGEITSLQKIASQAAASLSDALGCKHVSESAYCRFKLKEGSSKFGTALFSLIKAYLIANGAKVKDEKLEYAKGGYVLEISFVTEGADVITRISPVRGAHNVYIAQSKSVELCFAVTPSARVEKVSESDLKIDLF
ncbi:MAG: hypothetical protein K2N47_04030, partial [Clostridia bacterium]|nr:hypothetical protein [Clostridia bacterium]